MGKLGVLYLNKGMYSDAEIIFKNIIPLAIQNEKVNILSLTYLNLAETKMEQNLELEAATFIEETLKLKTTGRYTPLIAAHSILLYLRLNNLDYVELNFINTLDIIIKWNDKELFMLVIEKIFEKYVEEVLDAKIVALLDVTRKMILEKNISDLRLGYIFFIAADYFRNIDIKRSEEYFRFGLKVKNI
jgi:hypothetical protein